jgi:hypothetical protein
MLEGIRPLDQYEPYEPHVTIAHLRNETLYLRNEWQPLLTDCHFFGVQAIKGKHLIQNWLFIYRYKDIPCSEGM